MKKQRNVRNIDISYFKTYAFSYDLQTLPYITCIFQKQVLYLIIAVCHEYTNNNNN